MEISLTTWKALVEKKLKKKVLIKMIWNDEEKMTLFITPNMKINSFLYDEKEGYLFYDIAGNLVDYPIPSYLSEKDLENGYITKPNTLTINQQPLSKEDMEFLKTNIS